MDISKMAMRDVFLGKLHDIAEQDRRVILLSDDMGAPSLDAFRVGLSSQYVNVGIAEQAMVSIAAGLALGGKVVYTYGIAPFVTLRCLEQIKVDMCCMDLPITSLGVGAGYAYESAGPTHHSIEDIAVMSSLPGMTILNPSDNVMASAFCEMTYKNPGPKYVRFDRAKLPIIHDEKKNDFSEGMSNLRSGRDLTIIATGIMVHTALEVSRELAKHSIDAGVADLYRIKPLNQKLILNLIKSSKRIVTVEEHLLHGGIGAAVATVLSDNNKNFLLKRFGIPDKYCFEYGNREQLHQFYGLDTLSITNEILKWLNSKQVS